MSGARAVSDRATQESRAALVADALAGLTAERKTLPCKWLYDSEGARLFEAITALPEYYPTRTELRILSESGPAMARQVREGVEVVELGPGDGTKALHLLSALRGPRAYVPVDIAPEWLDAAASRVAAQHPAVSVLPVVADFARCFALPVAIRQVPRLGFFPGSTIGNFTAEEAVAFLRRLRGILGGPGVPAPQLLLGADLVKGRAVLEAAYDDAAGVTAAFNMNLLRRLNREAGAEFDLAGFRHRAVWNEAEERVEMHLVSLRAQAVPLAGRSIRFAAGETIHTENSHKYRPETMRRLAASGGWREAAMWTDPDRLFGVWLLEAD